MHVEQEAASDDSTVLQSVLGCDEERSHLLQEEKELMKVLDEVHSRLGMQAHTFVSS